MVNSTRFEKGFSGPSRKPKKSALGSILNLCQNHLFLRVHVRITYKYNNFKILEVLALRKGFSGPSRKPKKSVGSIMNLCHMYNKSPLITSIQEIPSLTCPHQ